MQTLLPLNSVNQTVFVMWSVFFEVRIELLNIIQTSFGFKGLTLPLRIRKVTGSNLGHEIGYPELSSFVVLLYPSRSMPG
jgi:hypothetical protein